MKIYKKVELVAKNTPKGSYVAGCPAEKRGNKQNHFFLCMDHGEDYCVECERTH